MNESIEMILHSKKLRYEILDDLMKDYILRKDNDYDTINIFVDIFDIIKQLYKPDIVETVNKKNSKEKYEIASELINIISHYRHYFFSRKWKYTNFYFFYSSEKSKYHLNIDDEYKFDFYKKRLKREDGKFNSPYEVLNSNLESAIKMLKAFISYVPHAYFIDSKEVEPSLIPYILLNEIEGTRYITGEEGEIEEDIIDISNPTIIISNDNIYHQDLILGDGNNVMQLLLKGNKSEIITSDNLYESLTKGLKNKPEINFSCEMYHIILSFMGNLKNYNVKSVGSMGIARSIKTINNMIDSLEISSAGVNSLKSFEEIVNNSQFIKKDNKQQVIKNFKLLSHQAMSGIAYSEFDIENIKIACCKELIDAKAVRYNNEKYFADNPVLTDFCFEGEFY